MKKIITILVFMSVILYSTSAAVYADTAIDVSFSQMFEEHGSIMLVIDSKTGAIEHANKAAADFYGYTIEQLESMSIQEINISTPEDTEKEMQHAVDKHRNYFVLKHRVASGDIRTVEVHSCPHTHGDKTILFSIIYDITAKTQLQEKNRMMTNAFILVLLCAVVLMVLLIFLLFKNLKKLKAQNQEISNFNELRTTFIDADNSFIYLKDENLKYVFVNKAIENFYNKESSEIIGCEDFNLIDEELAAIIRKTDLDVMEKKTIIVDKVKWKEKVFQTTKFPVKLTNGHYGVGAYLKDVTEEYNNKRKLEKTLLRNLILVDALNRNYQSTQEQLDYVLNKILKLTESKFGYIYVYSEENKEFILNSWSKDVMAECAVVDKQTRYQLEKTGLWGEVVRQRKTIVINDFQMPNPMKKGYPKGHVQLTKFMSIPVFIDDKVVAVLGLANKETDYDDNDIFQVTALMNGVWNAKERRERAIELEKTNIALKENQEKLKLILDSTAEAIYGIDLNGNCTFCNDSCIKMLGFEQQGQLIGKNMHWQWQVHHSRKGGTPLRLEECRILIAISKGEGVHVDDEVFWRSDGTCFNTEYYAYPQFRDGEVVGAVVTFTDITDRKKAESDIVYLSYHDSLTSLYNRRFFEEGLKRLDVERNLPISIIMGDVNGLKLANDIFGHAVGDELLKRAAEVMKNGCRADDIIARWGGDEYIIILPRTKNDEAKEVAEKIKNSFSREQIKAINGSISLGCDTKNLFGEDILQTIKNAENNMYSEKTLDRKKINSTTIDRIIETLHQNSLEEKEHSDNVSKLCQNIGRAMKLSEDEIIRLRDAGFLHDIGKIVLEDSLINKKGVLTDQDQQLIRQHPIIGYRILNSFDSTIELSKYVLSHHENWDGSGYPKGLKGEAIPKLARIIAIAESYDAMISGIACEKTMSRDEVILEIQRDAGYRFDPDIVEIFVEMIKQSQLSDIIEQDSTSIYKTPSL